ncbi:hypothetical protein [Flavobacterium marginilacus]|uniref:hypothetical protein n=1 Tax=Flavobacterium marginilacus TaxID=3003256 RepID=UPI00248E7225|nr:hypothetical protein [Flavobacterium marginilacus]
MKNYKSVFLAFFTLISCNQIVNHKEDNLDSVTTISEKKVEIKKNDNAEISKNRIDTIVVKNQTAIIIEPTDKQIEKRKKEVGEEDFYIGADDYMWYLNESTETFRKNKLNVLNIKNGKTIKFEMENGNNAILELNGQDELWQIYLFDPKLKPKKIDMTDSENEYKTYFKPELD